MRKALIFVLLLLTASSVSAQIIWDEDYHGRKIDCSVSGLIGAYTFCGIDKSLDYPYIFTGSIDSVTPFKHGDQNEFRLTLSPDEVFRGNPPQQMTVTTRAGECLDHDTELHVGDRWIFFLRNDEKTHEPVLWFDSGSQQVDKARRVLDLLHLQKQNPSSGFITGHVAPYWSDQDTNDSGTAPSVDPPQLPKSYTLRIKLQCDSRKPHCDGDEQSTHTDDDGQFMFPPLPPGKYDFDPNTSAGFWSEPVTIDVAATSCADVGVQLSEDGSISGSLHGLDGKPIQYAQIEVTPFDGPLGSGEAMTAADGSYTIHGLTSGSYYVGIGVRDPTNSAFTVFYPNSPMKQTAVMITLGKNEHRSDINFDLTRPYKH